MSSKLNKSPNVVWHSGQVTLGERTQELGQNPVTLWFTGLSASGKSTLSFALERKLFDLGFSCYVLDGDNVRQGLNRDLGFSHEDRTENIRRISEVAKLMNDAGLIVLTAFISPYIEDRSMAKKIIGDERFLEIYVNTPIDVCEMRDPKGLYKRARVGEIPEFTGINSPYEKPISPDITIDTTSLPAQEAVKSIFNELLNRKFVFMTSESGEAR